jgi:glycosyltransferase involved in cell wall biosynthesis
MKILFLTHRVPYPPDKGDRIRSYNIIKFLARNHSISLMSVSREPVQPKSYEVLKEYCESVDIIKIDSKLSTLRIGLYLFTKSPLTLPAFYSRPFHDAVQTKLQKTRFDLIYIYSSSMAQYVLDGESGFGFLTAEAQKRLHHEGHEESECFHRGGAEGAERKVFDKKSSELRELGVSAVNLNPEFLTAEARRTQRRKILRTLRNQCLCGETESEDLTAGPIPKIMDFIDVDSQKWFDYAAKARWPMKAIYHREGIRLRAFEKTVAARCELSLFTSESELKVFKQFAPGGRAMALPNGVDVPHDLTSSYKPNKLVFVGSMDYRPNVDAMLYFTREMLPLIQKQIPSVEFFIVGRNPSSKVKELGRLEGVTVTGDVDEVETYLHDAAASVIPLRIARGIQNKILEAMAHGVPVITTSYALDGITAEPGRDVLVADDPDDFAQKTLSVLKDSRLRNQLAVNGRALVEQEYHWENRLQKLEEAIASVQNLRDLRVLRGEEIFSDPPFVSFVIPAKNEEEMIGQCLGAVNNLDYDPTRYECIVVDNGSVDDTVKIARLKGAKVLTMPSGTISALRNLGARQARGDYVAFIDADCVIDKDWLKNALPHFADPTIGCVGAHPGIPQESTWVQKTWQLQNTRTAAVEEVDWLPSMNMLVKRKAFLDCGGFNESLITCEDVDFCYRLKRDFKIISDMNIKSVHFGEAKTVAEFFCKERWRGQSNLAGLLSHGFYWQEVPSLVLPIYCLVAIALLPLTLFQVIDGSFVPVLINAVAVLLPSLLLALRTSLKVSNFSCYASMSCLYLVYSLARAAAMIPFKQQERCKDLILGKVSP